MICLLLPPSHHIRLFCLVYRAHQLEVRYHFIQNAKYALMQPEFFSKYDIFILFFIFFCSTSRPQRVFAGQELKKRDWKFHTRYQTWFRRAKEPTEKAAHYEMGEFEYFDHSNNDGWCIRQRPGFKFEYEHLGE
jgi:CCR4-NOT transcription complex subunit 3